MPPEVRPNCQTGSCSARRCPAERRCSPGRSRWSRCDVVVAAGFVATGRRSGRDAGGSRIALGQGGRGQRANAQDDGSSGGSKTSVHGTIHLVLRGLRQMAVGRDLFSDLDLGLPQLEFRAVWHSGITPTFRPQEYGVLIRPRTTMLSAAAPQNPSLPPAPPWQEAIVPIAEALLSLVAAVESGPRRPAVKAFQAAIRRKGEEAAAAAAPTPWRLRCASSPGRPKIVPSGAGASSTRPGPA